MAPQKSIPPAANILGTIGTVLWCVQLVPQIWHNWRHKRTEGMPAIMMLLWAICAVPFGVYAVVQNFNIPIQIQPQIFGTLSLVTWAQIRMYSHKWSARKASSFAGTMFVAFGGIEALLILTLKGPYDRGVAWPMTLVGTVAAVVLAFGVCPPYFEMWKRKGRVIGINFIFLGMDWSGAVFSLMALVAQNTFDVLGGIIYIVVIVIEGGIFISQAFFLLRTRPLYKKAKRLGVSFDDLPEVKPYQNFKGEKPEDAVTSPSPEDPEMGRVQPEEPNTISEKPSSRPSSKSEMQSQKEGGTDDSPVQPHLEDTCITLAQFLTQSRQEDLKSQRSALTLSSEQGTKSHMTGDMKSEAEHDAEYETADEGSSDTGDQTPKKNGT